jgi:hypothetical protein
MVRVYTGATRLPVAGFDEDAMYAEFSKNKKALALESRMGDLGFRYVGDTASASKPTPTLQPRQSGSINL